MTRRTAFARLIGGAGLILGGTCLLPGCGDSQPTTMPADVKAEQDAKNKATEEFMKNQNKKKK